MPSSYTTRNRYTKQAAGEGLNVWGAILNAGALDRIDESLDGVATIATGGAVSLTTANGAADQARCRVLNVTAPSAVTITIPSVEKWYLVRAVTVDVTVTTGGPVSAQVRAGGAAIVLCDGAAVYAARQLDAGGGRLTNVGAPVAGSDAATKHYVDGQAFGSTNLPGITGATAGQLLTNDGAAGYWGPQHRLQTVSSNSNLAIDTSYAVETNVARTLTLPSLAGLADGQRIRVADAFGAAVTNNITVNTAGADAILVAGVSAGPVVIDSSFGSVELIARSTGWRLLL